MQILNILRLLLVKYWYIVIILLFGLSWWFYRKKYIGKKGLLYAILILFMITITGTIIGFNAVVQKEDRYTVDPDTYKVVPK